MRHAYSGANCDAVGTARSSKTVWEKKKAKQHDADVTAQWSDDRGESNGADGPGDEEEDP